MTHAILAPLRDLDPRLFTRLHAEITDESVYRVLQPLADTAAPSQTVAHTRARVVAECLDRQDRKSVV